MVPLGAGFVYLVELTLPPVSSMPIIAEGRVRIANLKTIWGFWYFVDLDIRMGLLEFYTSMEESSEFCWGDSGGVCDRRGV